MPGLMKACQCFLSAEFQSGEPDIYVEAASSVDCESWAVPLEEADSEGLCNKTQQLQRLIMEIKEETTADEAQQFLPSVQADSLAEPKLTGLKMTASEAKFEFSLGTVFLK
uniref:Uncharacterized protein n=1 Tax=Sphaerodactylus townsendi TaxID=933632 RepID=A0ACB8E7S9_9SAUR